MRTTLLDENGEPRYTNRLIHESSPYLNQHAHNPVDWFPWGDEAFEKSRLENKPIFLSIGYSTCHWCHVMEHESFDNEAIAAYLNEHFVSIKLDREQRPDLDDIYMTGVQLISGQGGWPMSSFITHEGKPFFAGTYFPPEGFTNLLAQINDIWHNRHEDVMKQADQIADSIAKFTAAKSEAQHLDPDIAGKAAKELLDRLDEANGGFGGAPKFPNESQLALMLDQFEREQLAETGEAVTLTLDKMYQGGIYDQIAGGFHRYTVDAIWLVPHFEKMLYNQAQLIRLYSRASLVTASKAYERVVRQTIGYVLRDMTSADGRFYSATDADSEGVEGKFFVWQPAELAEVLNDQDFQLVLDIYGVSESGNFEGSNILNLSDSLEAFAGQHGIEIETLETRLAAIHQTLYEVREQRVHPLRDEKLITAWNGMLITALVRAGVELSEPSYLAAAERALERIWEHHYTDQMLWRVALGDEVSIPGNLEDYAYLAEAVLGFYLVNRSQNGSQKWLARGEQLLSDMYERFWDEAEGGFFFSLAENQGPMITRPKSPMDGAMPSGNSVALMAMVLGNEVTDNPDLALRINKTLAGFSGLLTASPSAFSFMLLAINRYFNGSRDLHQAAAKGRIHVRIENRTATGATLVITMNQGWHINSNNPAEGLIATAVSGVSQVDYPTGEKMIAGFQTGELDVYSGEVEINFSFDAAMRHDICLTLQACDDKTCLRPETLHFQL